MTMPNPPEKPDAPDERFLEINANRRRWMGFFTYVVFFAAVALVIVLLLIHMGAPLPMALAAVVIMIAGMLFMAYLARQHTP